MRSIPMAQVSQTSLILGLGYSALDIQSFCIPYAVFCILTFFFFFSYRFYRRTKNEESNYLKFNLPDKILY